MTVRRCPRQPEVQELLARGHWPHACPVELRSHLADCRSCADLTLVTQAFGRSRATAEAQAQIPAPGAIWWRAQLRRRNAAVERVGKPILGAYVFAILMTVLVGADFAISQARHGIRWLDWVGQSQDSAAHFQWLSALMLSSPGWGLTVLIPVLATIALLGAVAVYLSLERQ